MKNYQRIELIDQDEESRARRAKEEELRNKDFKIKFSNSKSGRQSTPNLLKSDSSLLINSEEDLQEFPKMPIKAVVLTLFLLFVGLGFLIGGIVCYLSDAGKEKIITYLLFGTFMLIPGAYYSVILLQAYLAKTPDERMDILDEVPL